MKSLKDIVLKEGDIVTYYHKAANETGEYTVRANDDNSFDDEFLRCVDVLKIERPKYETIYEAQKEILTQKEKEYLEAVLKPAKENIYLLKKEFVNDSCYRIRISNNIKIDKFIIDIYPSDKYSFKGMELDKEYTIKELNLFTGE